MPDAPLFSAMFSFIGMFYGIIIPVCAVFLLSTVLFTSLLIKESKPKEIAQAMYCISMMSLGILLMSAGALPTIISVLAGEKLSGTTYFTLLFIFAAGGMLFLWHDALFRDIPKRSSIVSETIFLTILKIFGHMLVFLWGLSFVIFLFNGFPVDQGWWVMPIVMMAYGVIFIWCTKDSQPVQINMWTSFSLKSKKPVPKKVIKKVAKKPAKTKKVTKKKVVRKKK